MTDIPDWLLLWIQKDKQVYRKYKLSQEYIRRKNKIQLIKSSKDEYNNIETFTYMVNTRWGKYWVKYDKGNYECNCPFFKKRHICSHILGVSRYLKICPKKEFIFS